MSAPPVIQRELHQKALRESLWLAILHSQILEMTEVSNQLTEIASELTTTDRRSVSELPAQRRRHV
jgi:hypothetical protein